MALRSSGIVEAFVQGIERGNRLKQQAFENEQAVEREKRLKEEQDRLKDQWTAAHDLALKQLDLQSKSQALQDEHNRLAIETSKQALDNADLDRILKNLPAAGTKILSEAADPNAQSVYTEPSLAATAKPTRTVQLRSGLVVEVPTPEAALQNDVNRARELSAPALEAKQALESQKIDAAKEIQQLKNDAASEKINSMEAIKAADRNARASMASQKAVDDYNKMVKEQELRGGYAIAVQQIRNQRAAAGGGGKLPKLSASQQGGVTQLEQNLKDLKEVKAMVDAHGGWNWYFHGALGNSITEGAKGLYENATSGKGESDPDKAYVRTRLGRVFSTSAHDILGSAITPTELSIFTTHETPADDHRYEPSQAQSNVENLIQVIPNMIDNVYYRAGVGATPASNSSAPANNNSSGVRVIQYDNKGKRLN